MSTVNEIGIYQLENLVMQRVPFTLFDMTQTHDLPELFKHLNPYYLNFLKQQIVKITPTELLMNEKFQSLPKDSPMVLLCDLGAESQKMAQELETKEYQNVFYVNGGAKSITVS